MVFKYNILYKAPLSVINESFLLTLIFNNCLPDKGGH